MPHYSFEMANNDAFILHRYFLTANEVRAQFVSVISGIHAKETSTYESPHFPRIFSYMSLWYATLHVVVEGWEELNFRDERVDGLLADSGKLDLLRRYRNGVFHFQRVEWDDRFMDLLRAGQAAVQWIHELHDAIGDSLLDRLDSSA